MATKQKLEVVIEMVRELLVGFFDQENLNLYNRLIDVAQILGFSDTGDVYVLGLKSPEDIKNLQAEDLIKLMSAVYIWDCYKDLLLAEESKDLGEIMKIHVKIERRVEVVVESTKCLALLK